MKKGEILSLQVGRELDGLVAEKVMGYKISNIHNARFYSTEISDAWEIVEKFKDSVKLESWDGFICEICNPKCVRIHAKSASEAICKAALIAISI